MLPVQENPSRRDHHRLFDIESRLGPSTHFPTALSQFILFFLGNEWMCYLLSPERVDEATTRGAKWPTLKSHAIKLPNFFIGAASPNALLDLAICLVILNLNILHRFILLGTCGDSFDAFCMREFHREHSKLQVV
jgi:hypothetical protein